MARVDDAPDPDDPNYVPEDDSDDDDAEGGALGSGEGADGDQDMVLCLYDKVTRSRNKWKTVLKEGIASIDGKDYVFAKCTGEFEW